MKTAEVVKFDDLIRAGRDTDALRYFAQEYYDNGKMGHTRKLLIERAAERIEAQQAELTEIKTDQNSFIGHQNQVIEKLEQSLRAKMDTDKVLNRLVESLQIKLAESQRRESAAVDTLTKLLKHANDDDDICAYCNNQIICNGKSCESYREGVGDVDGNYPDWEWTCEDFNYGTCFKMQNTPCNGCFDNEYSGFEWRGAHEAGAEEGAEK